MNVPQSLADFHTTVNVGQHGNMSLVDCRDVAKTQRQMLRVSL